MASKKKENELDPNTQLEKLPFTKTPTLRCSFRIAAIGNGMQNT